MDELDRLYRRMVQNIRSSSPELLARTFEVSQIYQQIVPYRTNRRELGFESNDEYELALLQLLAGSRGFVTGDADMQRALRAELDSPNPDLGAFRVFATAAVALVPEALRALEQEPQVRGISGGVSTSTPAHTNPRDQAMVAARTTEALESASPQSARPSAVASAPSASEGSPRPSLAPTRGDPTPSRGVRPPPASGGTSRARSLDSGGLPSISNSSVSTSRPAPVRVAAGDACRYCGGALPEGRNVVFCPHCGHNLTIQHCPACGTELEVEWKFCVTCGRDVT